MLFLTILRDLSLASVPIAEPAPMPGLGSGVRPSQSSRGLQRPFLDKDRRVSFLLRQSPPWTAQPMVMDEPKESPGSFLLGTPGEF